MECNRDEAARAKEIAEKKFLAKDIAGAKKFAIKAKNLYPELEGISHLLETLNVYIHAENKINGEPDWYGVLGVNPLADEDAVRKQYRKLALMLHPDKNKAKGADGAFNLISQAWSLLSDKAKRSIYDQKRNAKGFQQKFQNPSGDFSAAQGKNGFYNFTKSATSNMKVPKGNSTSVPASSHKQKPTTAPVSSHKQKPTTVPASSYKQKPSTVPASSHKQKPPTAPVSSHKQKPATNPASSQKQKPNTFWTACHRCKMQYEYLRIYLNRNLLCPNCHEPFFSFETPPPHKNGSKATEQKNSKRQNSASMNAESGRFSDPNSSNHTTHQWAPFSKTTGAASAAQAASMVQQAYEKVKREREDAQAATKREEAWRRKNHASEEEVGDIASKRRRGMEDLGSGRDTMNQLGMRNGVDIIPSLSVLRQCNFKKLMVSRTSKPSSTKDASISIQHLLIDRARMEIHKKLNEWNLGTTAKVVEEESLNEKPEEKDKEKDNAMVNGVRINETKSVEGFDARNKISAITSTPSTSGGNLDRTPMTMDVSESEFHDFSRDRTARSFGENQVWAVYDYDDGMPRYYAMIHCVICLNPFKIRISLLNSKTNVELGPLNLNWIGSAFPKSCGDFSISKHDVIIDSIDYFSHKIRWTKGSDGGIQIYPRQGDIWCLYRNWSTEWNELTADEVIHKYDIVEVLEDCDDEQGIAVIPLVKVAGFKSVFHRHLDAKEVGWIPRKEMSRFSHCIPSHLLTGGGGAPRGCWELDPAATPLELLHVIPYVEEEESTENVAGEEEVVGGMREVGIEML